jgi:uncharacterized membrane protein YtjA (UPF0391 family)
MWPASQLPIAQRGLDQAEGVRMRVLHYAAILFVVTIIAAVFGMGGLAAGAADVAKMLFFVFLVVAAVMLVLGFIGGHED